MTETAASPSAVLPSEKRGPNVLLIVIAFAATIAVNLAVTLFVLDHYKLLSDREIVSINAADTLMAFVASQDPTISAEELAARVKDLNATIDARIERFASERGVIVVNSAAVLAGMRDATGELLSHLEIRQ